MKSPPAGTGNEEQEAATQQALQQALAAAAAAPNAGELASWAAAPGSLGEGAVEVAHKFPVKYVTWHARGDYLASVAPTGNTQVRTRAFQ